jgi:predicted DNA-binding transcriptional regulator AlpA
MTNDEPLAVAPPVLLVPIVKTAEELHVSPWTIRRWVADPATEFPQPINVSNRIYFYRHELNAWALSRPRVSDKPCVMQAATEPVHLRSPRTKGAA